MRQEQGNETGKLTRPEQSGRFLYPVFCQGFDLTSLIRIVSQQCGIDPAGFSVLFPCFYSCS